MRTVMMKRTELLDCIEKNRATHIKEFGETIAGWRESYVTALTKELGTMSSDAYIGTYTPKRPFSFDFPPTSHENDYDVAISMVGNDVRAEVELTQEEYKNYVLDDWDWSSSFKLSNSTYSGSGR